MTTLKEYFESQKSIKPTQLQKLTIYEKFLNKTHKKGAFFLSITFYSKVFVYTTIFLFIFSIFYYPTIIIEDNIPKQKLGTGFIVQSPSKSNINQAKADYIGRIIETNGDFKILRGQEQINTDIINNGDTILLTSKSQLKFQVSSGVEAVIQGPAKLTINYINDLNDKKYIINLLEGDYFQISSNQNQQDNIVVKTENLEIKPKNISEGINFKLKTAGGKKIVENKGSQLIIKNSVSEKTLSSNQKAQVNGDIKIIEEIKQIKKQLKDGDIKLSYVLSGDQSQYIKDFSGAELQDSADVSKKVISPEQLELLKTTLYPTFLMGDIENMVVYYFQGDKNAYQISLDNLSKRVYKAYDILGFEIESITVSYKLKNGQIDTDDLYLLVDQLITKINKNYYIPPQYTKRLNALIAWIVYIKSKEFGAYKGQGLDFKQIFDKMEFEKKDLLLIK